LLLHEHAAWRILILTSKRPKPKYLMHQSAN
jgi:hypothetical protein